MAKFEIIITAQEEELLQIFHEFRHQKAGKDKKLEAIAKKLKLTTSQILCAVGFNPNARKTPEIYPIFGFESLEQLCLKRNDVFTNDIYKRLTLENVLCIYNTVKDDQEILEVMQYLLKKRLEKIENQIEATVNSMIIEKYKAEMRSIYNDGVAFIEFAEERLNSKDCGFRALLNEVSIIIESKLIPAGDIFFRDTILPEEKRKIISKGLMPRELIQSRLEDKATSPEEKKILYDYLKLNREQE